MVLKKDIQLITWLLNKKIDFTTGINTITVDTSGLPQEIVGRFSLYEYVKKSKKPYKKHTNTTKKKKQQLRRDFIETFENVGLDFITYERYKKMMSQPVRRKVKIEVLTPPDLLPKINDARLRYEDEPTKPIERPKGQYSNKQWNEL